MRRALVTGGTRDDVAPMAVFAINIRNTNRELFDELVIYHDGIREKDQRLINQIFPTRFIKYEYPYKSNNDEVVSYFSHMVFCKYECFKLLEDYDEVVWSDYDVLVQKSLREICTIDYHSKIVSQNFLTCDVKLKSMLYRDIINKEILDYDLEEDGICTPIFTLSKSLSRYMEIYDWCYEMTEKWDDDLYLPEQCIFSLAVQKFDIKLNKFPFDKYACLPKDAVGDEVILHAAGQPKFWNGLDNDIWNEMYSEWLRMGGTRYSDLIKKLKRKMIFIKTRLGGMRARAHD